MKCQLCGCDFPFLFHAKFFSFATCRWVGFSLCGFCFKAWEQTLCVRIGLVIPDPKESSRPRGHYRKQWKDLRRNFISLALIVEPLVR